VIIEFEFAATALRCGGIGTAVAFLLGVNHERASDRGRRALPLP
jgi:hypothetical protein